MVLLILLAITTTAAGADWQVVADDKEFTAYYDPSTTHQIGHKVSMWTLNDYKQAQRIEGESIRSIKSQHEFDCIAKKRRLLFGAIHTKSMGKGIPYYAGLNPTEWELVAPESSEAYLLKFACAKK